jgi:hypothetical protein
MRNLEHEHEHEHDARTVRKLDLWSDRPGAHGRDRLLLGLPWSRSAGTMMKPDGLAPGISFRHPRKSTESADRLLFLPRLDGSAHRSARARSPVVKRSVGPIADALSIHVSLRIESIRRTR